MAFYYPVTDTFYAIYNDARPVEVYTLPRDRRRSDSIGWQCDCDPHEEDQIIATFEEISDTTVHFVPEIIIDSAEFEKREPEQDVLEQPVSDDTVEMVDEPKEPEVTSAPETENAPEEEPSVNVFVEDHAEKPTEPEKPAVEVILADFEDDIFAEERLTPPANIIEEETEEESGIDVEDKIEKLAEAAELAEVFRQENEDISTEDTQTASSDVFNVSIDDISVTPEAKSDEEEVILEYKPREKTSVPDENLFESVFKLPEGPIVFPTDIDDAEFQEQWLDEDEDGDDMASRNKRTRRRISAFIGAVVLLFAVMILFSAIRTVVSGFNNIGSTSEKKAEYTEFISPVVVNDPMPFESVDKADNSMLLQSSMLLALQELDKTEGYEHVSDATDKIVLPAENVEKAARELFGKDVKLNMNVLSENDGSALYYYDSIDKTFHITRSGITGPTAIITKIAQKSDYISLVVGYIQQQEMTIVASENTEAQCYKFMEYVLALHSDGSYYIKSIRNYVDD